MDEEARKRVRSMAEGFLSRGEATGWFEQLYKAAGGDADAIPWADRTANPNLVAWLDREKIVGRGRRALVVGCGLGDDAEALSRRGFDVTAFDIAPTAIDWCKKRFTETKIDFVAADLLDPPKQWSRAFDFVFESYTLQAVPPEVRDRMIPRVAEFVAPGGTLLIICRGRDETEEQASLPWPLPKSALDHLVSECGLTQRSFEDFLDDKENPPARRFRAVYERAKTT
jgi:SAM-dependent methyltransferase